MIDYAAEQGRPSETRRNSGRTHFIAGAILGGALVAIAAWAAPSHAADLSDTRDFRRFGSTGGEWVAEMGNVAFGRSGEDYDSAGNRMVKFGVKAGADGKAVVGFVDIGDTAHFESFTVNGQALDIPAPRANGSVVQAVLDFGRAGWHQVVAVMTLNTSRAGANDGFSVCR